MVLMYSLICMSMKIYFMAFYKDDLIAIVLCFLPQHLTLCSKEMVMEKPSPLLVGREFVRQYYTLLNKAPEYLHR